MTRRDVRVRPERRENLDIQRFAMALIGLAAYLSEQAEKPSEESKTTTAERTSAADEDNGSPRVRSTT